MPWTRPTRAADAPVRLALDHLVVTAPDLAAGVAHVRDRLGVTVPDGGAHPAMATHNRLMRLGPGIFLEVIAPDPAAAPPARPRWFALDAAGPPRLAAWVLRTGDLDAAHAALPDAGPPIPMARGALTWRITVPADGALPRGGAHPMVLQWDGDPPADRMADAGCRLERLCVRHPDAAALARALGALDDPRIAFEAAQRPGLAARIATPGGVRTL